MFLIFWLGLPNVGFFLCSARSWWCQSKGCEWNDGKDQTWGRSQTCKRTGHKGDPQHLYQMDCCLMLCIWLYVLIHETQSYICSACDLLNWLAHLQRFVSKVSGKPDKWTSFRKVVFSHEKWSSYKAYVVAGSRGEGKLTVFMPLIDWGTMTALMGLK